MTVLNPNPKTSRSHWLALILLVLGFVAGFLIYQHLDNLQQQIAVLQTQLQEAVREAGRSAEQSQAALERATQAEQDAQQAALERTQAEQDAQQADLARIRAEQASAAAAHEAAQARQQTDVATQQARAAREEADRIRERRELEIQRMQEALGRIAETERTALGLVMSLGSDSVRFDFDQALIRPEDREILSRISGVLLASYGFRIHVYGHTDDIGTVQYNQELSERRARAVRDYFVAAGIDPAIISVRGYGKSSPRVQESSQEARARNRRVEIGVVDTVIDYGSEVARELP